MENGIVIDIVDEKDKLMTRNQNWDFSVRFIVNYNKKSNFL